MKRKPRAAPARHVLAFSNGSSSMKFGFYRCIDGDTGAGADSGSQQCLIVSGNVDVASEQGSARLHAITGWGEVLADQVLDATRVSTISLYIIDLLNRASLPAADAIGHRVPHGGAGLVRHCRIDAAVLSAITAEASLAPLQAPAMLAQITVLGRALPSRPQFACFDSAFHAALPETARRLPLSQTLDDSGIRRHGSHGLSCESVLRQLGRPLPERIVIARLGSGSGSSITAIRAGRPVDTSGGLTATGGLPMASSAGDLDPGVLLQLLHDPQWTLARLATLLDRESGLLGISGVSGDLRRLHAVAAVNPRARLAIDIYGLAVAKQIAAMTAVLDGLDLLVFTGGIGEHDVRLRSLICAHLAWIGVVLYPPRNAESANPLSGSGSRVEVQVLPAQETRQIAVNVARLMTA